ncbi:uncharacterized protein LOC129596310 isoform X2 [Paramacrobiotus metropolitanus]|nr:uncharacterized protein LOC129596310 isoform X2 [Paramacrobiotus metropolitanus]
MFCSLYRDAVWAYQEILMEAMVVLWLGCHLSLKFGTRFFPDWKDTRVDPDKRTDLDRLLHLLGGYEMNGCVWDDIVSTWKPFFEIPVSQDTPSVAVSTGRATFAICGTMTLVGVTCILALSLLASLAVNMFWRHPAWKQHLPYCQRITAFFGYDPYTLHPMDGCIDPHMSLIQFWLRNIILIIIDVVCFVWVWLVFCALPMVAVAGTVVAVMGNIVGQAAVFPCCIVGVCLLTLHCTGRIWGFWMPGTYMAYIRKICRRLPNRRGRALKLPALDKTPSALDTPPPSRAVPAGKLEDDEQFLLNIIKFVAILSGLTAAAINSFCMLQRFPRAASALAAVESAPSGNWSYWIYLKCTECCNNYATGMQDTTAMLSYWVDLGYPRFETDSPSILQLFASTFSSTVDSLLFAWNSTLLFMGLLPFIIMFCIDIWGVVSCIWDSCCSAKYSAVPAAGKNNPENSPVPDCCKEGPCRAGSFCVCAFWADIQRSFLAILTQYLFWIYLPFPLVELFRPERLQLVDILLILSGRTLWAYALFIHWAWQMNRRRRDQVNRVPKECKSC